MEVELVRFIGAGLALVLSSRDARVPREGISGGLELVEELARCRAPGLVDLIARSARDVCASWRSDGISDETAAHCLEALPPILEKYSELVTDWATGLATGQDHERSSSDQAVAEAAALADSIVAAAASAGDIEEAGLSAPAATTLTRALLEAMAFDSEAIDALLPMLLEALAPAPSSAPAEMGLDGLIARLTRQGCPGAALEALVAAERADGRPDDDIELTFEHRAFALLDLLNDLGGMADACASRSSKSQLGELKAQLESGDFSAFDARMAGLEEMETALDDDDSEVTLASDLRVARARMDEIRERWPEAASHYAVARNYRPAFDVKGRWQLMMRQANALARQGRLTGDVRILFEAAQVHAEAGGLLQEQDAPLEWASAHVDLGNLLLSIAEIEDRPERYLAAALHFKPAVDVFSREGATDDWAIAQLGLARALKGQGEYQGDPVTLSDAAFAFRAALGMLHEGRSPDDWITAKAGLGETLVRIAEETGQSELVDEAVKALDAALATMRDPGRRRLEAALGRAYVVQAAERDDAAQLQKAVELIDRALKTEGPSMRMADQAMLRRQLGTSLWALGEAAGDKSRLEAAFASLEAAKSIYTAIGDVTAAAHVTKDVSNLKLVLARVRHMSHRPFEQQRPRERLA